MSGPAIELLDLVARWIHVIAGIMWVGNSLLFNWLDRNLRPNTGEGVYGDIWMIHSGGFYLMEKNQGERSSDGRVSLPQPLHWFKWQAYTTWLSGAALLIVVYYVGGRALLADPAVADIAHRTATVIAAGTVAGAFVIYELLWRTIGARSPRVAAAISVALLVVVIKVPLALLSARAVYVHVGVILGTLMAGNVVFTIMPSQRELVTALQAGREPSQVIADRAKTRSIHNNYLTFPVIVLMLSGHFPSLHAGRGSDLTLLGLIAGGAAVRHVLNIRFTTPRWPWLLAGVIAATVAVLAVRLGIGPLDRASLGATMDSTSLDSLTRSLPAVIAFDDVRRVVDRRCTTCHSMTPSDVSLGVMPGGVAFDTPEQIRALAPRILERAVTTRTMPPGNKTMMTERERAILAKWTQDPR